MGTIVFVILCCISVFNLGLLEIAVADDILSQNQFINESRTLESTGKKFKLGFFSRGDSKNQYLGIWLSSIPTQTIVWVANRNNPLNASSGELRIRDDGNLILLDQTKRVIWSTGIQKVSSEPTVAQILDSGNLVLRGESPGSSASYLWQSFDHPSDTLLAGMKLGWDLSIGLNRNLTSWRNPDDPTTGEFSYGMELHGLPQLVIRNNSVKHFRTGHWNGEQFGGIILRPTPKYVFLPYVTFNSTDVYYGYGPVDQLTISVLNYSGTLQRLVWNSSHEWEVLARHPNSSCEIYGHCGSNAICTANNTRICSCLAGYVPKSVHDWKAQIWSGGCVRKSPINCPQGEEFTVHEAVVFPDLFQFWMNTSMTLNECKVECLKNCSCSAYGNPAVTRGGSGCLLWYGDLIDVRQSNDTGNGNLYIRVTASEREVKSNSNKKKLLMSVLTPVSVALILLLVASCIIWKRRTRTQGSLGATPSKGDDTIDIPFFTAATIAEATNNFSDANKIGEGGFGSVYKGQLSTGQAIAVKRLSENSKQGAREFKNEVILIAKLQHRNLVRLLGYCTHREERMLIYEFMPNGSLSSFVFDSQRKPLTWSRRFNIIVGIARGLLYLHRDSRLRIIHRDLKASNVLLDSEMNPKIADFGLARAFGGDQLLAQTSRVVGTYGYMSPEYLINGVFSMKSDVFSYGVLVLEIVTGKRNREFGDPDHCLNLLGHAWNLWIDGKAMELVDKQMVCSFQASEVLKCIQIGLLSVQNRPEDRPTMASVVAALESEVAVLPQPKQPGFYMKGYPNEAESALAGNRCDTNMLTITFPEGR